MQRAGTMHRVRMACAKTLIALLAPLLAAGGCSGSIETSPPSGASHADASPDSVSGADAPEASPDHVADSDSPIDADAHDDTPTDTSVGDGASDVGLDSSDAELDTAELDVAPCEPPSAADLEAVMYGLCERFSELPCGQGFDIDQCVQTEISYWNSQITGSGCECEQYALLLCTAAYPLVCPVLGGDPHFSPSCAAIEDEANACSGGGDYCSTDSQCWTECDQYAADCELADAGGWICTCVYGPHIGDQFTLSSCFDIEPVAKAVCDLP